jgi:hypothetical protein
MKIIPCEKRCSECGFSKNAIKGTLQKEIIDCVNTQTIFPCHMELRKVTGSVNEGVELYAESQDVFRVCRGYIASMRKSGVQPRYELLRELFEEVSTDNEDEIMSLEEAYKYHGIGVFK